MSREAHVRFCEGLGLQCPGLLTRHPPRFPSSKMRDSRQPRLTRRTALAREFFSVESERRATS